MSLLKLLEKPAPPAPPTSSTDGYFKELCGKIAAGQARIGVIGLGYVGLPLACAFARKGHVTTGFDVDAERVARINQGHSYIGDVAERPLQRLVAESLLKAVTEFSALSEQDAIVICVPTPLGKSKEPDVSYIIAAAEQIKRHIRPGQLIILESTTYPGTTRELLLSVISRPDFAVGRDFFLAFSPERVDPGNPYFDIHNTPKVVGGVTPRCLALASALYGQVAERVYPVSSVETAEMTKLLENTFRAINIALVNELAMMCHRLRISVWEVIDAAKTKPFGFMAFYPGPGIGGHCIPLDPLYLAWRVKAMNIEPRFIELADAINSQMPEYVVARAVDLLNERLGKAPARARVLLLGATYKKDVSDMRESPALRVMELLVQKRAQVSYHDPHLPRLELSIGAFESEPLTAEVLKNADLVVILTDHSHVDYGLVAEHARLIFDTRRVPLMDPKAEVVRL